MFNPKQNLITSSIGTKNDNSPECPLLKRQLSVIEEHFDEETATSDKNGNRCAPPHVTKNIATSTTAKDIKVHLHHAESTLATKTRKKAIFSPQFPVGLIDDLVHSNGNVVHETKNGVLGGVQSLVVVTENNTIDESGSGSHPREQALDGALTRLKDTATKLNLKTRRPSYLTWRAEYVDKPRDQPDFKSVSGADGKLTQERKERIDNDLQWIKGELIGLRRQDQSLARQLLGIRHELSNLRLAASCEEHKDLLDDAHDQMEELRELSRFVDFPPEMLSSSPLRQIGVTKMNLSSRRFSTC